MSLFSRLMTVIKSNLNAMIGRAEDPSKIIDQSLEDMRTQFARAKQDVTTAIADEKKLFAQLEREQKEVVQWEERAMLAVNESRDDLAAQALGRQAEHEQSALQLHEAYTRHKADTEKLKLALRDMNDRIEELKRKKNVLVARQSRAEAAERIHGTMSSMNQGSAADTFARMEEKIEGMEHKAMAVAELSGDLDGDNLERQIKALKPTGSADQRLLALKQKMSALPAGAGAAAHRLASGEMPKDVEAIVLNRSPLTRGDD